MAAVKKTTENEETAKKPAAAKKTARKTTVKEVVEAAKKNSEEKKTASEKKTAAEKKTASEKKTAVAKKPAAARKSVKEKKAAPKTETLRGRVEKAAEPKINLVIEYAGRQIKTDDIVSSVTEAYTKANPDSMIETVEVYIQPEKSVAYYVVNGETGKNTKVKF